MGAAKTHEALIFRIDTALAAAQVEQLSEDRIKRNAQIAALTKVIRDHWPTEQAERIIEEALRET